MLRTTRVWVCFTAERLMRISLWKVRDDLSSGLYVINTIYECEIKFALMVAKHIANIGVRGGLLGATRILVTFFLPDDGGIEVGEGVSSFRALGKES